MQRLISNNDTVFHKERYFLETPMSPHEAAAIDGVTIELEQIKRPQTENHLVVEGAGAVATAAIMHKRIDIEDEKVCSIVSGGNIDVTMLSLIIEKGLVKSNRKMNLIVTLMDKPGALMHLTDVFTNSSANIVQIDYDRNSVKLEFGEAHVTIALETKGEEHQKSIRENLKQNGYRFKQL